VKEGEGEREKGREGKESCQHGSKEDESEDDLERKREERAKVPSHCIDQDKEEEGEGGEEQGDSWPCYIRHCYLLVSFRHVGLAHGRLETGGKVGGKMKRKR